MLGTSTGVGKTWAATAIVRALRAERVEAYARKPVQSFDPTDSRSERTDAHVLAEAAGEEPEAVCPPHRWYEAAMAPPMAADVLGRPTFTVADLVAETRWPPGASIGLVETVGGVRSPAAADGDSLALAAALVPESAVLVADAGLGTVNAVRLCIPPLATLGCPVAVLLNRFDASDDLHQRNLAYLRAEGLDTVNEVQALVTRARPGR